MRKFVGSEYGSLDAFALSDGEIPQPTEGEVRLKVEATALGFVDGLIALGRYQIRPALPYVPGGEIAGTVDATGSGVDAVSSKHAKRLAGPAYTRKYSCSQSWKFLLTPTN